jgi:hypothetical protein
VDDQLLIDNWSDHGETENQGQVELWGSRQHPIRLEYYENTGAATAKLLWSGPGFEKQVIPTEFLSSDLWLDSTMRTGLRGIYYTGKDLGGTSEGELPPGTAEGWKRMAKLGRGFVVWESNRTGAWRIWYRALDGSGLHQVSPDEPNRDHFAPHLSPDGARFIYLSYPKGENGYEKNDPKMIAPMYVINLDGSGLKQVAANARCYGEDRAAVWLNDEELIYIAADHGPTRLNLRTGAEQPLSPKGPWLINRTATFATTGDPTFSPYDAGKGAISEQPVFGGCQPYFSTDGVWGYWMGGAGGPINRVRLATREVSPILDLNDKRLPADRNYLYFPMLSYDQRLFAFAASPGVHDHFKADYDVFVAPCDPNRLELTGRPVRYTFNQSCDRFPDAFLAGPQPPGHGALAQFSNPKPPALNAAPRVLWPVDQRGLVFAWRTADVALNPIGSVNGRQVLSRIKRRHATRFDHNSALVLDGGACLALDADQQLIEACKASNELTIEATIKPANTTQGGPARIVTFSTDPTHRDFTLGQEKDHLILRLRTPQTGENGVNPELNLGAVKAGRTVHVVITYADGRVVCYLDGKQVEESREVHGNFSNWSAQHLLFGDEWSGQRDWAGTLEGVAVFSRALNVEEAQRECRAYQQIRSKRPSVPRLVVDVELVKLSKVPTLKEILPYQEALFVSEYRVKKVIEGKLDAQTLRVAHWALLDGKTRTPAARKPGWSGRLYLESFEANPQLKSLFLSDTLDDNFEATVYYDSSS